MGLALISDRLLGGHMPTAKSPRAYQFTHSPWAFPCWNCGLCLFSMHLAKCHSDQSVPAVPCFLYIMTWQQAKYKWHTFLFVGLLLQFWKLNTDFLKSPTACLSPLLACICKVHSESFLTTLNHLVLGILEDTSCQWANLRKECKLVADPLGNAAFSGIE